MRVCSYQLRATETFGAHANTAPMTAYAFTDMDVQAVCSLLLAVTSLAATCCLCLPYDQAPAQAKQQLTQLGAAHRKQHLKQRVAITREVKLRAL